MAFVLIGLLQEVDQVQLDADKARISTDSSGVLVSSLDHQTVESALYNTSAITVNATIALDSFQISCRLQCICYNDVSPP